MILYLLSFNYFCFFSSNCSRNSCKIRQDYQQQYVEKFRGSDTLTISDSRCLGTPCGHTPPSCNAEGNVLSWRWTSHGNSPPWYSQIQQLATEVWFPCSKHRFVEAVCPLQADLKNVSIIETWKQSHFIVLLLRIANSSTSRGLQKLLAIRKRKANILAHRTRLFVLCYRVIHRKPPKPRWFKT